MPTESPKPKNMKHEWSWQSAEWSTLPDTLEDLEGRGWEIFSVVDIGDISGRFCKVIYRKRIKVRRRKVRV